MKRTLLFLAILICGLRSPAQTNGTARLALIAESDEASTVLDVLTAQLSGNQKLQLLERNEIEKVYREQGLSAGNKDYLKLGQILGADGLLLLDVVRTAQETNLTTRLIAVKPGVVLLDEGFQWPLKDISGWAPLFANHLNPFVPKLTVLVKDAIPISVVNLRSALQSDEGKEAERQLKLLTIQRLSREPQFFVLERERMQLLAEEKDLKLDDSAFWKGSYLLEGVVDQNGYSKETITINARLMPPKGSAPMEFEISGSRTNLVEVINKLAVKVNAALKVNSTAKEWSAANEAQQYFDEAKWAMRWGVYSEAQAAVESAWALGKHDEECGELRVRAYTVTINTGGFFELEHLPQQSLQEVTNVAWNNAAPERPWGLVLSEQEWRRNTWVTYAFANKYPEIKNIDQAMRSLMVYQEFSQTLSQDNLKTNTAWFDLGVEDMTTASQVLLHFHFVHSSQKLDPEKLAKLRSLARSVAEWISKSPTIFATYWGVNSTVTNHESENTPAPHGIFGCMVTMGYLWQEKPEDCVAMYRDLMRSPAFRQLHQSLWFRPSLTAWNADSSYHIVAVRKHITIPALAAWNEEDRNRVPTVWNDFAQELKNSTNQLSQIEAEASTMNVEQLQEKDEEGWLTIGPTKNDQDFEKERQYLRHMMADQNILSSYQADKFIAKPYDYNEFLSVFQLRDYSKLQARRIENLLRIFRERLVYKANSASGEERTNLLNGISLITSIQSDVTHILNAEEEAKAMQSNLAVFEERKQYLKKNKPFDLNEFASIFWFGFKDYSKTQALEIQPLLASYKSNLIAQVNQSSALNNGNAKQGIIYIGQEEEKMNSFLNLPPASKPNVAALQTKNPMPVRVAPPIVIPHVALKPPETVTNILSVTTYLKLSQDQLKAPYIRSVEISSRRWSGGKLLLDLRYEGSYTDGDFDTPSLPGSGLHGVNYLGATAIFDPDNGTWQVIEYPGDIEFPLGDDPHVYHAMNYDWNSSVELFQNNLLLSFVDQIYRYDLSARRWQTLAYPGQKRSDLFAINGHLYAANDESILEILDLGASTRLLASTRRHPAKSALDAFEGLGKVTLFDTSIHPLCAKVGNRIFSWEGTNWMEQWTPNIPNYMQSRLEPFDEGQLIRSSQSQDRNDLWVWRKDQPLPELWLRDVPKPQPWANSNNGMNRSNQVPLNPLRRSLPDHQLTRATATLFKSDLYFLLDHSSATNLSGRWVPKEKDGYNATLVCFSHDFPEPFIIPMRLAMDQSQPVTRIHWARPVDQPRLITDSTWMRFEGGNLYIGQGETLGIWAIPAAEIESVIALQKQPLIAKKNAQAETVRQLLVKYDRNHNGIIDPDEREELLDEPALIEAELEAIDTNHNRLLDAEELVYFDANKNKTLDPKEQAGIEIAQHLLAERLLKRFDANGDGWLDRQEFSSLLESTFEPSVRSAPGVSSFLGANRNHIGPEEMDAFLDQQTRRGLRPQTPIPASFRQVRIDANQPADPRHIFKMLVEFYWQNPGGGQRPPVNNRLPSSADFAPNQMQHSQTQ